jgi:hypothetical protein
MKVIEASNIMLMRDRLGIFTNGEVNTKLVSVNILKEIVLEKKRKLCQLV